VEVLNRAQQIRRPEACMVLSFYQEEHQPEIEWKGFVRYFSSKRLTTKSTSKSNALKIHQISTS
jgi:hypothetical protein